MKLNLTSEEIIGNPLYSKFVEVCYDTFQFNATL